MLFRACTLIWKSVLLQLFVVTSSSWGHRKTSSLYICSNNNNGGGCGGGCVCLKCYHICVHEHILRVLACIITLDGAFFFRTSSCLLGLGLVALHWGQFNYGGDNLSKAKTCESLKAPPYPYLPRTTDFALGDVTIVCVCGQGYVIGRGFICCSFICCFICCCHPGCFHQTTRTNSSMRHVVFGLSFCCLGCNRIC